MPWTFNFNLSIMKMQSHSCMITFFFIVSTTFLIYGTIVNFCYDLLHILGVCSLFYKISEHLSSGGFQNGGKIKAKEKVFPYPKHFFQVISIKSFLRKFFTQIPHYGRQISHREKVFSPISFNSRRSEKRNRRAK